MIKTILVSNLPHDTSEGQIRKLFSPYGTVQAVRMIVELTTGRCRGYAFVDMDREEADVAIGALNGKELDGRRLYVGPLGG